MTDDEIRQRFPGVEILLLDPAQTAPRVGWGVEINGKRRAWLLKDTPENQAKVRRTAVEWLETL